MQIYEKGNLSLILSGDIVDESLLSRSNQVRITFQSNAEGFAKGFIASFQAGYGKFLILVLLLTFIIYKLLKIIGCEFGLVMFIPYIWGRIGAKILKVTSSF